MVTTNTAHTPEDDEAEEVAAVWACMGRWRHPGDGDEERELVAESAAPHSMGEGGRRLRVEQRRLRRRVETLRIDRIA